MLTIYWRFVILTFLRRNWKTGEWWEGAIHRVFIERTGENIYDAHAQSPHRVPTDNCISFFYYFTLKLDGGNLPRYYSNTINNKIKLISNFTNYF